MDLIDSIRTLAARIPKMRSDGLIKTEEGTKNALIMPFIQMIGYNVFDPTEVTPELIADVGIKKGEKVDYAILRDGKPIILFECKMAGTNLRQVQASQLYRYFSVTAARFGILTDGIQYMFFTDMAQPNIMDSEPFFIFDMMDVRDTTVDELKKFTKTAFDENSIVNNATILKRRGAIKSYLTQQLQRPTEEFVRACIQGSKVGESRITQTVLDDYNPIIREALRILITEQVEARLKSALEREEEVTPSPDQPAVPAVAEPAIVTTEDEKMAHMIVKAILRDLVDASRVAMRDAQSYCAVFLDDNNRRPICRFNFGQVNKTVTLFDDKKHETKVKIESLDEIYKHADALRAVVKNYIDKFE